MATEHHQELHSHLLGAQHHQVVALTAAAQADGTAIHGLTTVDASEVAIAAAEADQHHHQVIVPVSGEEHLLTSPAVIAVSNLSVATNWGSAATVIDASEATATASAHSTPPPASTATEVARSSPAVNS